MTIVNLDRTHFQIFRSAEYLNVWELEAQTGQPASTLGEVVLKGLIDNALDACKSAGIDPVIHIGIANRSAKYCSMGCLIGLCPSTNGIINKYFNIAQFEQIRSKKRPATTAQMGGLERF